MVEHQPRLLGSWVRFPAGAFAIFSVSAKASLPISLPPFPFLFLSLPLPLLSSSFPFDLSFAIAFLKRVFGSRSTAGCVPTPQDLSVTKQHQNDRWDRCTVSAGDWLIIMTASHRSANQRYFMHN